MNLDTESTVWTQVAGGRVLRFARVCLTGLREGR